ncbi:Isoprenylcysteine carboxyl methyltransferase [Reticulomyxa filosa]|uniref:Protein-S-isoprenylcysteine O-methyltransferase n=1 Tax=Reticulomyxa filosa TaxID=46433 RepID=X6M7U8_RETFI|nr:Isoprenylcysteine carboxyl methyltransferase [Reticulomyxa filosa]|eukprot:ETO09721.1 Isoprenylcysteine carboxyl methyltransferase [Reticulomyxa filosa]
MWTMLICRVENHQLVKNGPYRFARHPTYTVLTLFSVGFFLCTGSWLVFLCLVFNVAVASSRIRQEERLLVHQFGQEYIDYMEKTGAFCCIPKLCDCGIDIDNEKELLLLKYEEARIKPKTKYNKSAEETKPLFPSGNVDAQGEPTVRDKMEKYVFSQHENEATEYVAT